MRNALDAVLALMLALLVQSNWTNMHKSIPKSALIVAFVRVNVL
jgi:hypothetical protein